jgi:hypothetical protein
MMRTMRLLPGTIFIPRSRGVAGAVHISVDDTRKQRLSKQHASGMAAADIHLADIGRLERHIFG